ncbi:MAG: sensor histidine kinase [Chitinophagales bacterium]
MRNILNTKENTKALLWGILIVGSIPTIFQLLSAMVFGTWNDLRSYLIPSMTFSYVVTASLFFINFYLLGKFQILFPKPNQSIKRLLTCLPLALVISNIVIFIEWWIYNELYANLPSDLNRSVIFTNQILATVLTTIVDLSFEVRYFIIQWKNSAVEAERLQKENTVSQLESLRSQLNPHFLFNSFNALQLLIEDDPNKAKQFVQELSKVYRYVLDKKDEFVVELKDEIGFINSYIYLHKIRFGDSLVVNTNISSDSANKYLPPLTLQLLLENAIKHNIISSDKPLIINIQAANNELVIRNNFQPRNEKNYSTGIGQQNLLDRYKLIYDIAPEFGIFGSEYVSRIPLILKESV